MAIGTHLYTCGCFTVRPVLFCFRNAPRRRTRFHPVGMSRVPAISLRARPSKVQPRPNWRRSWELSSRVKSRFNSFSNTLQPFREKSFHNKVRDENKSGRQAETKWIISSCQIAHLAPLLLAFASGKFIDREHTAIYLVEGDWSSSAFTLQPEEVEEVAWMELEDVIQKLKLKVTKRSVE